MGRKRKQAKLIVVSFRIEPDLAAQLKQMRGYSKLLRKAIREALK